MARTAAQNAKIVKAIEKNLPGFLRQYNWDDIDSVIYAYEELGVKALTPVIYFFECNDGDDWERMNENQFYFDKKFALEEWSIGNVNGLEFKIDAARTSVEDFKKIKERAGSIGSVRLAKLEDGKTTCVKIVKGE